MSNLTVNSFKFPEDPYPEIIHDILYHQDMGLAQINGSFQYETIMEMSDERILDIHRLITGTDITDILEEVSKNAKNLYQASK